MKKLLIMAVMIVMTFSLTACGTDNNGTNNTNSDGAARNGITDSNSMNGITGDTGDTGINSTENTNGDNYFNATVVDVKNDKLTVKPENNDKNNNADEKLIASDSIEIDAKILDTLGLSDIKSGDKVRVVYDKNSINDDYSKIDKVYTVYRIDDKGEIVTGE